MAGGKIGTGGKVGVDKAKIREAIAEIERQGQPLTVRAVRERVGGSNSTILAEIHAWRAEQQVVRQAEQEQKVLEHAVPEEVWEQMKRIVTGVWRAAMEAAEGENRALRNRLAELNLRLEMEVQQRQQDEADMLQEVQEMGIRQQELETLLVQTQDDLTDKTRQLLEVQGEVRVLKELLDKKGEETRQLWQFFREALEPEVSAKASVDASDQDTGLEAPTEKKRKNETGQAKNQAMRH